MATLLFAVAGCSEAAPSPTAGQPVNTPGATPNDAASVNCPASGGPSSGGLTGLGATIGQFRAAHQQDSAHTSDFGGVLSGGPNDGLPAMTARCSNGGIIVSVDQNLAQSMSDTQVKTGLASLGIAPRDSQFQSAQTPGACEIFFYKSDLIARDPGANDMAGTFLVELGSPVNVGGWDATNVADLIYDLDESGGC